MSRYVFSEISAILIAKLRFVYSSSSSIISSFIILIYDIYRLTKNFLDLSRVGILRLKNKKFLSLVSGIPTTPVIVNEGTPSADGVPRVFYARTRGKRKR